MADWDGDGDLDVVSMEAVEKEDVPHQRFEIYTISVVFHEGLADGTFKTHELLQVTDPLRVQFFGDNRTVPILGLSVADWDEDGKLDLLLCFNCRGKLCPTTWLDARVYFLNRTLLPLTSFASKVDALAEVGSMILSVVGWSRPDRYYRQICDMDVADFDEDGDLDLFLDKYTRYFERQSTGLIERPQPFGIYNYKVWQVFDFDADGHLEVLVNTAPQRVNVLLGFLRRGHDGSFLLSAENPFADIILEHAGWGVYFADWNSDGLPDLFVLDPLHGLPRLQRFQYQEYYYQQTRSRDMAYNSHLTVFENIPFGKERHSYYRPSEIKVLDWNQDGLDDHVFTMDTQGMGLYEVSGLHAQEVPAAWDGLELPNRFVDRSNIFGASLADWDGDGDLDVLLATYEQPGPGIGQLHYQEREAGHLKPSRPHHQFSAISYQNRVLMGIFPIDWDRDGDMDLVLSDGRYFEQLADGSFQEQQQNNPFRSVLTGTGGWCQKKCALRFLDCDGDGDLDVLRVQGRVQACEHDSIAGTLRCSEDFKCLGTNLSSFLRSHGDDFEKFGRVMSLDVVNVSDGQLKFVAFHEEKSGAVLWTAGFCIPLDRCHGKGFCEKGRLNCTCGPGHELGDCSRCKQNFHGVLRNVGQVRECKRCPEDDGKVCRGRGECFDDAAAQTLAEYATAVMAAGNGSCRCYEAGFVCLLLGLQCLLQMNRETNNIFTCALRVTLTCFVRFCPKCQVASSSRELFQCLLDMNADMTEQRRQATMFPQQRRLMGSSAQISSGVCRCGSKEQVPEEGSGRFRRRQVPEASRGFRCMLA